MNKANKMTIHNVISLEQCWVSRNVGTACLPAWRCYREIGHMTNYCKRPIVETLGGVFPRKAIMGDLTY